MNKLLKYFFSALVIMGLGNDETFAQAENLRSNFRGSAGNTIPNANLRVKRNPKLYAARNRFLSQQLALSEADASKFWPLYNQYQEQLTAVLILRRMNNQNAQVSGTEQIDKELAYDSQVVSIKKHYRDEFLKILPADKVNLLYKSEREFNDEVKRQLNERSIRAGN
ncbi:hypothetical protein [Mucilaginibacter glaciei]|uniref:Sensor of ECF-type sigma factor n=1 Tax=Mucilaginibacter glaciei TaxID=2772109 RepID=A0A926NWP6_9SPHI|nr:hypothetical protein [Mucilaginibacter glaciei]MBD1393094.1 hypothetical protein [Mucilaginibacter glaciei]